MTNTARAPRPSKDQREYERIATALAGKLFVPAEESTSDCQVINLSAGGACVKCDEPPPLDAFVVLYIEGFGRFECVATRYERGELGIKFVCKETKRQRLLTDIANFIAGGIANTTRLRRHPRMASASAGHFARADGELVPCDLLDISLQGLSLRTKVRPPIGEIVNLGLTRGRVIRHHEEGIAIQFLVAAPGGKSDGR
jgi:hypothetical protein